MKKKLVLQYWLVTLLIAFVATPLMSNPVSLEEFRLERRFGVGISAGGPLATLGLEFDFNLSEFLSLSGGVGTGLDYSTVMAKAKYFLLGKSVSPYFAMGFARWWTDGTNEKSVSPAVLRNKFLVGEGDLRNGFSVYLFYPAIGVQFLHLSGLSIYAEVQYLFKLVSFANGTYAGLGVQWFF